MCASASTPSTTAPSSPASPRRALRPPAAPSFHASTSASSARRGAAGGARLHAARRDGCGVPLPERRPAQALRRRPLLRARGDPIHACSGTETRHSLRFRSRRYPILLWVRTCGAGCDAARGCRSSLTPRRWVLCAAAGAARRGEHRPHQPFCIRAAPPHLRRLSRCALHHRRQPDLGKCSPPPVLQLLPPPTPQPPPPRSACASSTPSQ